MRGLERFVVTGHRSSQAVKDEWVGEVHCDCGHRSSQAVKDEWFGNVCCDCEHRWRQASQAVKGEGMEMFVVTVDTDMTG